MDLHCDIAASRHNATMPGSGTWLTKHDIKDLLQAVGRICKLHNLPNFCLERVFLLTAEYAHQSFSNCRGSLTIAVIEKIILGNFLPDNSTYHVIFSRGVKRQHHRSLNGGFTQRKIILTLRQPCFKKVRIPEMLYVLSTAHYADNGKV